MRGGYKVDVKMYLVSYETRVIGAIGRWGSTTDALEAESLSAALQKFRDKYSSSLELRMPTYALVRDSSGKYVDARTIEA